MSDDERNKAAGKGSLKTGRERNGFRNASLVCVGFRPCSTSCMIGPQVTKLRSCSSETPAPSFPFSSSIHPDVSTRITDGSAVSVASAAGSCLHTSLGDSPPKGHFQKTPGDSECASHAKPPSMRRSLRRSRSWHRIHGRLLQADVDQAQDLYVSCA